MKITHTRIHKPLAILVLIALASISTALATRNVAARSSMTFNYLLGTGFLCSLGPHTCPDIARASNGDNISITGSGSLSVFPKSVTGSGNFTHTKADGVILASGTWTATQLIEFVSYGNATPQGLPASFFAARGRGW